LEFSPKNYLTKATLSSKKGKEIQASRRKFINEKGKGVYTGVVGDFRLKGCERRNNSKLPEGIKGELLIKIQAKVGDLNLISKACF